jgi:hypothetical protein
VSKNKLWSHVADWESQGDWMLQTKVWVTSSIRDGVGTSIEAFTGPFYKFYPKFSKLGLLDLMTVTQWDPPNSCHVIHTGAVIKGTGTFELVELEPNKTQFNWSETVVIPRALLFIGIPLLWAVKIGVIISLRRLRAKAMSA